MYPYYLTQTTDDNYCLFTFFSTIRISINCLNRSNVISSISNSILMNPYFQNITQISLNNQSSLSKLPASLCTLPSTIIDLSNQSFSLLNNENYPCRDNSTIRTILIAYNQISSVNLTLNTWILIDLTSNRLTEFPYDLFNNTLVRSTSRQTISSNQKTLLLSLNRLSRFDLIIYTYSTTTIDLRQNPFIRSSSGYHIIENSENRSLSVQTMINTNVNFPTEVQFLVDDRLAQDYDACTGRKLAYLVDILNQIKSNNAIVQIDCSCSSFYLKAYYNSLNVSSKITDHFRCSSRSNLTATQFEMLIESQCLTNLAQSSRALCRFARMQVFFELYRCMTLIHLIFRATLYRTIRVRLTMDDCFL